MTDPIIPHIELFKDRFQNLGLDFFGREQEYFDRATKLKNLFTLQRDNFEQISRTLGRVAEDGDLSPTQAQDFSDGSASAGALYEAINAVIDVSEGLFFVDLEFTDIDRNVKTALGKDFDLLTQQEKILLNGGYINPLLSDTNILDVTTGIEEGDLARENYNKNRPALLRELEALEHFAEIQQQYKSGIAEVKRLSDAFVDFLTPVEILDAGLAAVTYAGVAYSGFALFGGASFGAAFGTALSVFDAFFDIGIRTGIRDFVISARNFIFRETVEAAFFEAEFSSELGRESGLLILPTDNEEPISTGVIKGTYFAVVDEGVDSSDYEIDHAVTSAIGVENFVFAGSSGVDKFKSISPSEGTITVATAGGNDEITIENDLIATASDTVTINAGSGKDKIDVLANNFVGRGGSEDDEFIIRRAINSEIFGDQDNDTFRLAYLLNANIDGGSGIDTVDFSDNREELREGFGEIPDTEITYDFGFDAVLGNDSEIDITFLNGVPAGNINLKSIERIIGTPNDDTVKFESLEATEAFSFTRIDGLGGINTLDLSNLQGVIDLVSTTEFPVAEEGQTIARVRVGGVTFDNFNSFVGGDGNDRFTVSSLSDVINAGKGDDTIIDSGGDNQIEGGAGYDTFNLRPGSSFSEEGEQARALNADGLSVMLASTSIPFGESGKNMLAVLVDAIDLQKGKAFGTSTLSNVETVKLTNSTDIFDISADALNQEITVDLGFSRRLQSEIDAINADLGPGETPLELEDDAFIRNLDIADYSDVGGEKGILYFKGTTGVREQGLVKQGGLFQLNGFLDEFGLIVGENETEHALKVEGADKIILTDKDDVLIAADRGSIVDLGGGQDKVWAGQDILVQNFGFDDRLTLFGISNLYGGFRNSESDSPWARGYYTTQWAIDPSGALVVNNPWIRRPDDTPAFTFIDGFTELDRTEKPNSLIEGTVNAGPGDITLGEITLDSVRFKDLEQPTNGYVDALWGVFLLKLRTLDGSDGRQGTDPLVLDLDGDGIELNFRSGISARFDYDYDLYAEQAASVAPDDGLLARDINGNGKIDDGSELFGFASTRGFSVLADLDGNGDGIVDANDNGLADFNGDGVLDVNDRFEDLLVWQDTNFDLESGASELKTVVEHGITSFVLPEEIDTDPNPEPLEFINGSSVVARSSFTREDGSTGGVSEVFFNTDDQNTRFVGPEIEVVDAVSVLPNLSGIGTLTSLHQSLSYLTEAEAVDAETVVADRVAELETLVQGFASPDLEDLVDAFRPIGQLWASTAPFRNGDGEIITGVTEYPDIHTIRTAPGIGEASDLGVIVDYAMTGDQTTEEDDNGFIITTTNLFMASGRIVSHLHSTESGLSSSIEKWADLRDALLGNDGFAVQEGSQIIGVDGGEIVISDENGSADWSFATVLDVNGGSVYKLASDFDLNILPGDDLGFFARYLGSEFDAFFDPSAAGDETVQTLLDALALADSSYKILAVTAAVQAGPLSQYFNEVDFDVSTNSFVSNNPERQLGGVYENLLVAAAAQSDPITWLESWGPFLDVVHGEFDRGESQLQVNNAFILQNIVDGYEASGSSLDFETVAVAFGLPEDVVITGAGELLGTDDVDLYYLNSDDQVAVGTEGADFYVFGRDIGHDVIREEEAVLRGGSHDQIRFASHTSDELEFSREDLDLVITVSATGETVRVEEQFKGIWPGLWISNAWTETGISEITFANGEVWLPVDIVKAVSRINDASSTLVGTSSTDFLEGGAGDDRLEGGGEYDIYYFSLGDGKDLIFDHDDNPFRTAADSIYFDFGIGYNDLSFSRDGNSDALTVSYGNQGDEITIIDQFERTHTNVFGTFAQSSIEFFVLADGQAVLEDQIMGVILDQITTGGDDIVYGFDRDDRIDAGAGDDWIQGFNGNDTYVFGEGYGSDIILEGMENLLSGTVDTVEFREEVAFDDVTFSRDGGSDNLVITLTDGSRLEIVNQFAATFTGVFGTQYFDQVERFEFEENDGSTRVVTSKDVEDILIAANSTSGDDQVFGFAGSQILESGLGDDFVSGGAGNDIYRYNLGDGDDVIEERGLNVLSGTFDVLEFGAGITPDGVALSRGIGANSNDLILTIEASGETVTLVNQFEYFAINYRPNQIEEIRFSDAGNTVWTADDIKQIYLERQTTSGNDEIEGFETDDVLNGDVGSDVLRGGDGDDTYIFGLGSGNDTIEESVLYVTYTDHDTVLFGPGITSADVSFAIGNTHTDLVVTLNASGETLTIKNQNGTSALFTWNDVETFRFEDGSTLSKEQVIQSLVAGQATSGDDTVKGFYTNDVLDGGLGNDRLEGGNGADTYLYGFGSGNDTILDDRGTLYFDGGADAVQFGAGITTENVSFSESGTSLIVTLDDTGETLTIERYLGTNSFFHVEELRFEDGTVFTRAQVQAILVGDQGTDGDETITGTSGADTILAGLGNDILEGGENSDTYIYRKGDGQDTIDDGGFRDTDVLIIEGYSPQDVELVREPVDGGTLVIQFADSSDQITIINALEGSGFGHIEEVRFEDGTVWTPSDIQDALLEKSSTDGDDVVYGFEKLSNVRVADTIEGGLGDDYLVGKEGGDMYIFNRGDGRDMIRDQGRATFETDTIEIRGYTEAELSFSRYNPTSNDLLITFDGTQDSILVRGGLGSSFDEIETVRLDDGTEFSLEDIQSKVLEAQLTGGAPVLIGSPGDDVLNLNSEIRLVDGGDGDDIAIFTAGDGPKFLSDSEFGTTDTLRINGYTPDQVTLDFEPSDQEDVIVRFAGSDEYIYLVDAINNGGFNGFEQIEFEDGTVWTNAQLQAWASAASSQYVLGDNSANTFTSTAENEFFEGRNGADTYVFEPGFGFDVVSDSSGTLQLNSITASEISVNRTSPSGNDVAIVLNATGDTLLLEDVLIRTGMSIEFGNGEVWDNQQLRDVVLASLSSDGDDAIEGANGPDDSVSGGLGNDFFDGKNGDDTYTFSKGDGRDTIRDSGTFGTDTVQISGYARSDVLFSRFSPDPVDEDHLLIRFANSDDEILILDSLDGGLNAIEQIRFDDGSTLALTNIRELIDNQVLVGNDDQGLLAAPNVPFVISANDLLSNDVGSGLRILDAFGAENGTVTLGSDGTVVFTPEAGFTGQARFTYSVKDENGALETAEVSILVTPLAGDLPANFELVTIDDVLGSQDEGLEFASVSNPVGGVAEILPDGRVLFIPNADFEGAASFEYEIDAGSGTPFVGVHTLTIGQANTAPVVTMGLNDLELNEDNQFEYAVPVGTFSDAETAELDYTASLQDGSDLPEWLQFSPLSQTFFGNPPKDFFGELDVTVTGSDGVLQASAGFTIRILNVNDAPVVEAGLRSQRFDENQPLSFAIPDGTFVDADNDTLSLTAQLTNGSPLPEWLQFNGTTRTFEGTPPQDFVGFFNVEVIASDGEYSVSDRFRLEIVSTNEAPVVATPLIDQSSAEDANVFFAIPDNTFTDVDGDNLTVSALLEDGSELPSWLSFDGSAFSGTPPQDFNGTLGVTVFATDGEFTVSDTFTLDIAAVNDAPVVATPLEDQSSAEDTNVFFSLPEGTFSDVDSSTLTLSAALVGGTTLPAWLIFDAEAGTFSGTPPQDFNGTLSVSVFASDGELEASDTFSLAITPVNDAPIVHNPINDQSSAEDEAISFILPADTFSDVDGDTLSVTALLADGSPLPNWLSFDGSAFTGTPPQDFNGTLSVTVFATDGEFTASDIFTLDIAAVNDAPIVVNPIDDQSSFEDAAVSFELPNGIFSDVDGDTLTLTATLVGGMALPTWLTFDANARSFSGTPPQDFNGTLGVTVFATDGEFEASDTFSLEIAAVNDAPIVVNPIDDQAGVEDAVVSFALPDDIFNDIDGDALTLNATLANGDALPSWLSFDDVTRSFNGTPPQNFNGTLSVTVFATDGELTTSDTFALDIAAVNDAPIVVNPIDDQAGVEDTTVSFVLPNGIFSDVDGDTLTLTATLVGGIAFPTWLTFDANARSFSGTPPQDFNGALDVIVTATDGEFEASDTFSLDIAAVNDAPIVVNPIEDQSGVEDTTVSFALPADIFSDVDGDTLTLSATLANGDALPSWLSFDESTRTFNGTPPQDINGTLSVTVFATDGEFAASDTFTLDIAAVNDAPIAANDDGFGAISGEAITIDPLLLLANDNDVDGDVLSIVSVESTSGNATVSLGSDGNITYTANAEFIGEDTFEYVISDGDLVTTGSVTVNVDGSDNPYEGWQTGTDGRDILLGDLFGSNQIYGAGGNDLIIGGFYSDQIDGGTGRDRIYGLWGNDTLNGNEGNDRIYGGGGSDIIAGNEGNDRLWGGWGQDTFVFNQGDGRDRIMDYDTGRSWGWWSQFNSSGDRISINVDGIESFEDLMDVASQRGRNTVIDFGDGDKLILNHTRLAALDQDAFTFF